MDLRLVQCCWLLSVRDRSQYISEGIDYNNEQVLNPAILVSSETQIKFSPSFSVKLQVSRKQDASKFNGFARVLLVIFMICFPKFLFHVRMG